VEHEAHLIGVRNAANRGYDLLSEGKDSLHAVEEAVKLMEDDPTFNAGKGSHLNERGDVEMDAMIMDGVEMRFGSVAAVRNLRHPIELARRIMEEGKHCMMVGEGAVEFARLSGMEMVSSLSILEDRERERWKSIQKRKDYDVSDHFRNEMGTVGAVAIDEDGRISAATSTGGTPSKRWGRVGDTPIIGCGTYADRVAGVSATGWGESILRVTLASRAVDHLRRISDPMSAAARAILDLQQLVDGLGGLIMIDSRGGIGYAHNTPGMAFALRNEIEERTGISAAPLEI